jgi:hypothetical protein
MTWPGPKLGIPESVRDLDHARAVAVLVATNVNISVAARRLHVPSSDLRRLMNANPDLLALAAEKEERRLDKAEAILERELNSDDPRCSAAAAFFVLRHAKRAVARGWRQPDVEISVDNPAPAKTYVFKWAGDESNLGETMLERDGKSVPVPRYDCGDDCIEGEAAATAALIGHKPEPEHEHEPLQTLLPVWPGPGLPPPLVANLYTPYSPPPMIVSGPCEEPPTPRPAVLRRRRRV